MDFGLSGRTLIIVESEPVLRQGMVDCLHELGLEDILEASYTNQAFKALQRGGIDLVIVGWETPRAGGIGLLKQIRQDPRLFTTPTLLVAESLTKVQVVQAGRAGVSDIIILPFATSVFAAKLRTVFEAEEDEQRQEVNQKMKQGLDLVEQGRYEEALEMFQGVTEVYESAEVYYNLGYIKAAQEMYEQALIYFRKATEIDHAYAQAYQQMALCYAKTGRSDQAEEYYQRAAEIFMERGNDQIAEEMLQEVLKINPDTVNVFNTLGIIYRRKGDLDGAVYQYRRALKVNPNDGNILYNLGRVFYDQGQIDKAIVTLQRALRAKPGFREAEQLIKRCFSVSLRQGPRG